MRFAIAILAITLTSFTALGQAPPTLHLRTEVVGLPSELFYGDIKVKPLRLRPGTNIPITINDSDFFVHQHYVDFLSRMPDQGGFSFWNGEITSCGGDVVCIDVKRQNVSAAFFLSIEFQQTGYLVYRIYKSSFGDLPGKPVPVRRESFMPETRSISNGLVVGLPGWEALLEGNKQAYALAFVQRPAFLAAFPTTMPATQFVDKLDLNAAGGVGGVLSSSEKDAIVAALNQGPADPARRATALRAVAENQNLQNREFNKAFVLMQYFGYLRRNPDDLPDHNYDGWQFWYDKLNNFNGNFIQAEMVKAFILSIEYGQRF
ncbi:MAG: hypothetical protein ACREBG_07540 [Pyrinomonadaceae bacterium]